MSHSFIPEMVLIGKPGQDGKPPKIAVLRPRPLEVFAVAATSVDRNAEARGVL